MKPSETSACLTLLALCLLATPALAQDEPRSDTPGDGEVGEPASETASDATRVVRIRQVIELDTQHLRWLRSEIGSQTRWFERLSAGMGEVAKERDETRERLETLEANPESDPAEIATFRAKVEELQEDWSLYDVQTDLALKGEKTVRRQLEALEKKIAKEERALGLLTGEIEIALPETAPAEAGGSLSEAAKPVSPRLPVPVRSAEPTPAPKQTESSSAMTSAQLQARRAVESRERDVEVAKIALSDFVERKRALARQVEFEEGLAENERKQIENLERVLGVFTERVEKYREANAAAEKIQRRERGNREIARIIEEGRERSEGRAAYIATLVERLAHLDESELSVTAEVDAKQEAAAEARRRAMWLESPIHPRNIQHWAKERGPRILLVLLAAFLLLTFVRLSARRIARTLVRRRRGSRATGTGRADTLAFSFRAVSRVLIVVLAVLLVLQEAGVDLKTVLGGAAILGVAIAFGAQDLMRDYFSGFLILAEDQYQLGDLITIGTVTGTVESVNMRVTVLRDLEGRVHFMPNGSIDHVTNRTYAWGRPVIEVPVAYDEDVDRVMDALVQIAKELGQDPAWEGKVIGEPEMLGVDKFTEYGVVIKFMVKTKPEQLFAVRRELLRRISIRFNELGIRITVPQRILLRESNEPNA